MSLFTCAYSYLLVPHCKVRVRGGRESMQEAGKREREIKSCVGHMKAE